MMVVRYWDGRVGRYGEGTVVMGVVRGVLRYCVLRP